MQLNIYKNKMLSVQNAFQQVKSIAREMHMSNAIHQMDDIMQRMTGDDFHLVIVGEFSRGKSTFVNALLGKRILPASKNPTTAIISKIIYGEKPAFRIHYKNGKPPLSMEESAFKKLTAPPEPDESDIVSVQEFSEKQKKINEIDFAEISYPLPFCKDKVEVVDTPGTNDLNVGRMEITYGYLNQADAVILLLAAYQPLSSSEAQFLKERILGNQIQDIFFVIGHKDDLDDAEQEKEVVDFVEQHLRELLPESFPLHHRIFLVNNIGALYFRMKKRGEELSARQELKVPDDFNDTGFPALESALGDFLANEKGMVRLRKYNRDAQEVIRTMQHDIFVNIGIVSHSADEIRQKAASMEPKFRQVQRKVERIISDMKYGFDSAGSDIDYKCHAAADAILSKAKEAVEDLTKDMSASAKKQAIERSVTAEKKHFMDTMIQDWQSIFERQNERAQKSLRSIWKDIDNEYQRNFNLSAIVDDSQTSLSISSLGDNKSFSEKAYDFAEKQFEELDKQDNILDVIGCLGSCVIAETVGVLSSIYSALSGNSRETWRDKIRSEVIRAYSGQGDRMAAVMKPLYRKKTEECCRNLQKNVDSRIADMEQQLQDILREKEAQEQDVETKKDYLLSKKEELRRLSQELSRLTV